LWNEIDRIKAPIAAYIQSIGEIGNAKMGNFNPKTAFHELIRGSQSQWRSVQMESKNTKLK